MLTRQQEFEKRSQRRWYAVGTILWPPYRVPQPGGGEVLGCQTLAVQDVESQCFLHSRPTPRAPAPFTADEILSFADEVFTKFGVPKQGLLILPSTWRSVIALHDDPVTRERVAGVREMEMDWAEMCEGERLKIALRVQSRGIALAWEEGDIPNKQELLDY
jgi:hypothetical protein